MIDQRKKEVRKEVFSLYKAIRHIVLMRVSKKKFNKIYYIYVVCYNYKVCLILNHYHMLSHTFQVRPAGLTMFSSSYFFF